MAQAGAEKALFVVSLELPVDATEVVAGVLQGGPDGVGERLVRASCEVWDPPAHRERLVAVMRALVAGGELIRRYGPTLQRDLTG